MLKSREEEKEEDEEEDKKIMGNRTFPFCFPSKFDNSQNISYF